MRRAAAFAAILLLALAPGAVAATCGGTDTGAVAHPSLHGLLRAAPTRKLALAARPARQDRRTSPSAALSPLERDLVAAMNRIRAQHGLRLLAVSTALSNSANAHSVEMVKRGYFEHESANGEDFAVRVARYYPRRGAHVWSVGENLAYGCPALTVDEAMDMWMHSAGHRANILHGAWTRVGVGIVHVPSAPGEYGGDPTTVMTVDFGVRR